MGQKRTRGRALFAENPPPELESKASESKEPESKEPESNESATGTSEPHSSAGDEHVRITAYLSMDQVDRLDRDRIDIRWATRAVLERTAILRGLVEGYRTSGLDLAALEISTEAELAELVRKRLAGEAP